MQTLSITTESRFAVKIVRLIGKSEKRNFNQKMNDIVHYLVDIAGIGNSKG